MLLLPSAITKRTGEIRMELIPWNIARLQDLVDLWNQELGESFPMGKELFEQNSFKDKNVFYEGSCIAIDNDHNVIGFIVTKKWQEQLDTKMSSRNSWIQVLLVDHRHRQNGIGTKLLKHAESALASSGLNKVVLGRDPWHYFPGIPKQYGEVCAWFEKRGYQAQGSDYDLICQYDNPDNPPVQAGDVTFSILDKKDKDQLLEFLHRCFPGRWEYEAIHYFQKGGTGREFLVLKKNNQIIGFCRINDGRSPFIAQNVYWAPLFNEELGGIGPLGIDANERKQGYGLAIVEAGVERLRNRNIDTIVIDWTGLVDFYNKLGYEVWKSYISLEKDI